MFRKDILPASSGLNCTVNKKPTRKLSLLHSYAGSHIILLNTMLRTILRYKPGDCIIYVKIMKCLLIYVKQESTLIKIQLLMLEIFVHVGITFIQL